MSQDLSRSKALIAESLLWDNHGCMPLRADDTFLPQLERYRQAGFSVASLNVGFDQSEWHHTFRIIAHFRGWIERHPEHYVLADSVKTIEEARRTNKLAVFFDIEGGSAIDDQISLIDTYYELGVRWMLLAYNNNNRLGGGCHDDDCGLTAFGKQVLDEMARVGMVVCCSHVGQRTALETMEYSANPVILSHSNPRTMWDHPRNVRDAVMKACAATGGVMGLNGIGIFLGNNEATAQRYVGHLDYAVQLIGPDHVGMGLDYVFDMQELDDYVGQHPELFPPEHGYTSGINMLPPDSIEEIVEAMLARGYADGDIKKILGGNFMRVFRAVAG